MLQKLLRGTDVGKFPSTVVCMTEPGAIADGIRALSVPVETLGMRRGIPDPRAVWRLHGILRRIRPAVLQTWLYHSDLLGLVAGRLAGVPAIAWNIRCSTMDERYTRGLGRLTVKMLAWMSKGPQVVVSNSFAGIEVHEQFGYRPRRWEMIPNGFDLDQFRPDAKAYRDVREELGLTATTDVIGLVARFDPIKDHQTFLAAAARLAATTPAVHFVLVGPGVDPSNSALIESARKLGVLDKTHMLGERSDIARLTAAMDVATCSSKGEGFANVIGEAMACGVPVVCTDVGDARAIVGETGLLVRPGDAPALAEAWARLLDVGSSERQKLGASARQRISDRYSLRAVADSYAALFTDLARRNSGSA